jgi:hypothetical protein
MTNYNFFFAAIIKASLANTKLNHFIPKRDEQLIKEKKIIKDDS